MKQPKFRLKSLLEYRRFMKTQAAGRLAEAARKRAQAFESVVRVNELLSDLESELQISSKGTLRASELLILQEGLANRRHQVDLARQAYEAALAEESEWRDTILKLQQEYESVLKLQERHLEQVRTEALREEEIALNEFTTARFKQSVSC